jgi:hypothetical protein
MMPPSLAARSAAIFVENEVVQLLRACQPRVLALLADCRLPTDTRSWFSRAATSATSEPAASVPVDSVVIAFSVSAAAAIHVASLAAPLPSTLCVVI